LATANRAEEGLMIVEEALALAESTGEQYSTAELYRLKGELMLRAADQKPRTRRRVGIPAAQRGRFNPESAETAFFEGLKIAQEQSAKSWEVRLLASIEHLRQGRTSS
jgi:predicted ATPase